MKNKKSGFTLIELLVVSTIIIVLATIGMVSFSNAGKSARDGKRKSDMETIRQALTLYKQQTGSYPNNSSITTTLTTLSAGYISQPVPADPKAGGTYVYYGTASTFCVCATLEKGNGNVGTIPTDAACSGIGAIASTNSYYCAKNL